jgi:hypothetical protein
MTLAKRCAGNGYCATTIALATPPTNSSSTLAGTAQNRQLAESLASFDMLEPIPPDAAATLSRSILKQQGEYAARAATVALATPARLTVFVLFCFIEDHEFTEALASQVDEIPSPFAGGETVGHAVHPFSWSAWQPPGYESGSCEAKGEC